MHQCYKNDVLASVSSLIEEISCG